MTRSEGTVLSIVGGVYRVHRDGDVVEASLRGRVKITKHQVLVGDRVSLEDQADGTFAIDSVLPRGNVLRRRTPGRGRGVRNVAANVDQVVVVGSSDRPRWDAHLIDRFVVIAETNEIPPIVVVNKIDLVDDASVLGVPYVKAGYRVIYTSVRSGTGVDELRGALLGHVSLFNGTTGVGKSSLLNALEPGLELRTGQVSVRKGVGRHTTVAAEMHPLTGGGFVVDTPGLRDVGLWVVEPEEVIAAFPEFADVADRCRFDDCRHLHEPDCKVVAACERGEIDPGRLESYRRLLGEALEAAANQWG